MVSNDGAEVSESVGLYLLHRLQQLGIPVGLNRDDGLGISDKTPRRNEIIKKDTLDLMYSMLELDQN